MSDYEIRTVTAAGVRSLRLALVGEPEVDGDGLPEACHLGAYRDEVLVGVGSIHPESMPAGYRDGAWRVHGLGVEHGHRGIGVGALLLERLLEHAAGHDPQAAWCVAPAGVYGFFERFGFRRTGEPLEGSSGPQYLLYTPLGPLRRSWAPDSPAGA